MFERQLKTFGLNNTQARVLDFLFENGQNKASFIAQKLNLSRALAYNALQELVHLELAEKKEKSGEIAVFLPSHPSKIENLLEKRQKENKQNQALLRELLPNLLSGYNLALNKPGIQFYEGKEGLEKVLFDTLESKTEVYLLLNRKALAEEQLFVRINEKYKKKRMGSAVKKKIIRIEKAPLFGKPEKQKYRELTEVRYLEKSAFPFKTALHVYDNKVSLLIFEKNAILGILLQDKNIFQLNKFMFESLWENAKSSRIDQPEQEHLSLA